VQSDAKKQLNEEIQLTKKKVQDRGACLKNGYDELRDTEFAELESMQNEVLK
jgi:hypothetical protein